MMAVDYPFLLRLCKENAVAMLWQLSGYLLIPDAILFIGFLTVTVDLRGRGGASDLGRNWCFQIFFIRITNFETHRKIGIRPNTGRIRNKSFLKIFNFLSESSVSGGLNRPCVVYAGHLKRRYRWTWGTFHSSLAVLQQQ